MAGFSYRKNLDGSSQSPTLMYVIGKSSVTFSIGDLVRVNAAGFCDVADAAEYVVGVVAQVVTRKGLKKDPDSATALNDYTMTSDNQTVAKDMIGFIPALPNYLFYNDADEAIGEENIGMYFDAITHTQIDGDSHHDTTTATFRLWEVDPDHDADLSKGLYNVCESQIYNADCDREA